MGEELEEEQTYHVGMRNEKVADCSREVVHSLAAEGLHGLAHLAQEPEIVIDGDERDLVEET